MIYLYYGKIGDGKTYHIVRNEILPAVRAGRQVYTNCDGLDLRRLLQVAGMGEVKVEKWRTVEEVRRCCQVAEDDKDGVSLKVAQGALVVIDEAQLVWDARAFKDMAKGTLSFLEQHRHWGLDVVLVTQSPGRLDKAILRLANECYHVKNLRFLTSALGGRYVVNVRQSPFDREAIATFRGKFDPEIFSVYRSAVTASRFNTKKSVIGHGAMLWGPLLAVVAGVLWLRSGGLNVTKGQAVKLDTGVVKSEREWPKPGPELARLDPPKVDTTSSVEVAPIAGELDKIATTSSVKGNEEREVVGTVEVDGVVRTYYKGDKGF